ncbi:MAG: mannitol-/sugar-/sorbitol-6-phosphatase [Actinomycetota bacterium]|nr:mannitol-/sugar-/sorbitol-6-phosphatase [Actinomycetota bacterium]
MTVVLPPSVTTVLFDMDGVLIDSSIAVVEGYSAWAMENDLDPDEVLSIVHGRRTIEVVIEFGFSDDAETEADRLERSIAERATIENAIEATCELYRALDPARVGVATSARRETALSNLEVLGLERPRVLVNGQDVEAGKPSPDPYLLAAKLIGARPEECVVIEDAPAGILAGKAAGCHVIALVTTHEADELGHADQVIEPGQLQEVFERLIR